MLLFHMIVISLGEAIDMLLPFVVEPFVLTCMCLLQNACALLQNVREDTQVKFCNFVT